jgi:hypothetical protein
METSSDQSSDQSARNEQRVLAAFDGAYATFTSLSRNSGLRGNELDDAIAGLVAKGLFAPTRPELFAGVSIKGYDLTAAGRQALTETLAEVKV